MNLDKGDLVLRHDGACIYILGSDNRSFHGICSARNESFISYTSILKHDLKPESQSEVVLGVIKYAHPDVINEALSARRASKSQFNEWSLREPVVDNNTLSGEHKSKLKSGVTIVDRFGKAYLILHVDQNIAYVFRHGTYKQIDLSEFRENLKHRHARLGIRCYFGYLPRSAQAMALSVDYLPNKVIEQLLQHQGVDLRTDKDKGIIHG
ncbi:hypothetical protein [Vibrio parahaemolyticus]|uniref:hypothetical protein n=1 Tax=Vibrio parahaemolyticus TaxID=670 RepID=UPI0031CCBA3C